MLISKNWTWPWTVASLALRSIEKNWKMLNAHLFYGPYDKKRWKKNKHSLYVFIRTPSSPNCDKDLTSLCSRWEEKKSLDSFSCYPFYAFSMFSTSPFNSIWVFNQIILKRITWSWETTFSLFFLSFFLSWLLIITGVEKWQNSIKNPVNSTTSKPV